MFLVGDEYYTKANAEARDCVLACLQTLGFIQQSAFYTSCNIGIHVHQLLLRDVAD